MINVAFVCLGNICRSPMAELIFKKMLNEKNLQNSFRVSSFATSDEEEGNNIYPPAQRCLKEHGIEGSHIAKQLCKKDVINNDYILVMDSNNLYDVLRLTGGEYGQKIYKLMSFTGSSRDVADPWFTRNFEKTYQDVVAGCEAFLNYILCEKAEHIDYDNRH